MFHVERTLSRLVNKGKLAMVFLFLVFSNCIGTRQTFQISDYILLSYGKESVGTKNLTAFVFENNLKKQPIEQYLSTKFNSDNYSEKEFWITIEKEKYKIIIYDYAEFEKYFGSANFSPINLEPENEAIQEKRKFLAISMINAYNEDCLADNSLFQNIAVKYLKKLKDEYYNQ